MSAVRDIFDRELEAAEDNCETSGFIGWLTALRDEVLLAIGAES